jgi:Alpha-kinase family/von Willebrand factor type A domain
MNPMFVDDYSMSAASTQVSFIETAHARLRREQRNIDKKDLQAALKYGTRKRIRTSRRKFQYTYNHIVYIVEETPQYRREITCYAEPLVLERVPLTKDMEERHHRAVLRRRADMSSWTSNTVMVIDTSGSMRTCDVWGSRTRLDSVWVSVALDFLAERLESGVAGETDMVSIVQMGEEPVVLFREVPTTWVLYNSIVDVYNACTSKPKGHGFYLRSLMKAEELLMKNANPSCAAAILFLSDGAPSDQIYLQAPKGLRYTVRDETMIETVESFARKFGRRLTFTTVGIGSKNEFPLLQRMADAAKDFGACASFMLPSMTSSSLGEAITSVATSLTNTQIELTDVGTMKQRKVRDVLRESKSKASEKLRFVSEVDFYIYPLEGTTRKVYREEFSVDGKRKVFYDKFRLQHPDSKYVAFSKCPFGEGGERFVHRFYEIAADKKTILGVPMVAKESRMVLEGENESSDGKARKTFVQTFCETQQIARRFAMQFNDKLTSNPRIHPYTPLVSFLDCSIYELEDTNLGRLSVLVENRLDENKWFKWNSNNGTVNGVRPLPISKKASLTQQNKAARINSIAANVVAFNRLDIIMEESNEEEGMVVDDVAEVRDAEKMTKGDVESILFSPSQVAQAFSHFTYCVSNRKRLVCDLQGVFDEYMNELQFSDPVIHYYDTKLDQRSNVHGRTDRGRKGMDDFFSSHCCKDQGYLCQLVSRGFVPILCSASQVRTDALSQPHQNPFTISKNQLVLGRKRNIDSLFCQKALL